MELLVAADILLSADVIPEDGVGSRFVPELQPVAEGALDQLRLVVAPDGEGDRVADPPAGLRIPIMIEHQRALTSHAVGVRENVLVDVTVGREEVVEEEVFHPSKKVPFMEQWKDLVLVTGHQILVRRLVPVGAAVLHAVLFCVTLHLSVTEHGKARHGGEHGADAEVLVPLAELVHRCALVRVVHEVDVPLHDARIELQRVFHHAAVAGVLLVPEHVHEGAVVDPVHTQGADEVALHEPERLGQEERIGDLLRHSIDHLPPELFGQELVELLFGHAVFRAGGDRPACPWLGEPEALVVLLGQRHSRVEADDGELAGHVEDHLDDRLADFFLQEVELRRVVPGHARTVVPVVNVDLVAGPVVDAFEDHGSVSPVVIAVLEVDTHAVVAAEIGTGERIGGEGTVLERDESIGMIDHPMRVDAHMVGDHITRQTNPALPRAVTQALVSVLPTQLVRHAVILHGIGGGDGFGVAHDLLDALGGRAALPESDEPQPREPSLRQGVQLLVWDLVQPADGPLVGLRELIEPDVGVLGDEDHLGHPCLIRAEALVFRLVELVDAAGAWAQEDGLFLLGDQVEAAEEPVKVLAQQGSPALLHELELTGERVR